MIGSWIIGILGKRFSTWTTLTREKKSRRTLQNTTTSQLLKNINQKHQSQNNDVKFRLNF